MASIPAIGIDLGTTNTCVGVYKNGKVELLSNDFSKRLTPSFVYFDEDSNNNKIDVLIGDIAKDEAYKNPKKAIYDVKRIIGRDYDEKALQNDLKNMMYEVVNKDGKPKIRVQHNTSTKEYYPEEICSYILKHVKCYADDYFGEKIKKAVISVPAYFNNSQREATKVAGELAGLDVIKIISEPTAAALAYGWENKSNSPRNVLIYDFGGGTFDVSIVRIDGEDYTVKGTNGDTHLGGVDIDNRVVNFIVDKLKSDKRVNVKDLENVRNVRRIRARALATKETLSVRPFYSIEFDLICDATDITYKIMREEFEEINADLFQRTLEIVAECIKEAKMTKRDITDIVLVGGSTKIPKVQAMLRSYFDGKNLIKSINIDEAVAYGATIQAAIIQGGLEAKITDVTALSLSIEDAGGICNHHIKRNTPIPCEVTCTKVTSKDNQKAATFMIYQGNDAIPNKNHKLGEFTIKGLPPKPKGEVKFATTLILDYDGILFVQAENKDLNLRGNITIGSKINRIPVEEMKRLLLEEDNI